MESRLIYFFRQSIKCPLCDACSPSKYHLAEHICRHLSYRKYECKTCAELFYTKEERGAHCIERDHIHTNQVKISQYCEHFVSIFLKDAEYVALHGVDAVVQQRTRASMA
uniref:C2H2-type domain-containing protein n=1 Tax=Haemonchus contortus TaxID=6289 RepID=A0A7I4Y9K0_HAECO